MFTVIYDRLKQDGFNVYSIGQHEGLCKEPYVVIKENNDNGEFKSYTPPPAGSAPGLETFTVDIYTEETDTSGEILGYVKLSLPNGKGEPVELAFEDNKFFAAKYSITTAPAKGEPPYTIEMVDALPVIV